MTKIYKCLWITILLLLSGHLYARVNETQRALLARYLHFYYIESPNKPHSPYKLNNAMIAQKNTCTRCGNFWTNPNTKQVRDLLSALFCDTKQGGDLNLQNYAYQIVKPTFDRTTKPVQIWIYDDFKEPLNQAALSVYQPCESNKGHVWPCAAGLKEVGFEGYGGFMHLGTSHMHRIGIGKTKATFLHELSHAQDNIVAETDASHFAQAHASHLYEPNLWLLNEARQQGKQTVIEAAPSWALAYREGLANTFGLLYDPKEAERMFQWYLDNAFLLVDAVYDKKTKGISEEEWLYDRISKDLGNEGMPLSSEEYDPVIAKYYRTYRMKDLSPAFIIRNEMIMALMFYGYVKYIGLDKFNSALGQSHSHINFEKTLDDSLKLLNIDDERDRFRLLFVRLSSYATPSNLVPTLSASSGQGPKPYLLLMAYIDYFTRYRIQSKEEFAKLFGLKYGEEITIYGRLSTYIDLYWAHGKDKVRNNVTLFDAEFGDLALIAKTLGIPVPE